MNKTLKVYGFSNQYYATDILGWLQLHHEEITDPDLVAVTSFLVDHLHRQIDFNDLPVLLANGERLLLSEIRGLPHIQALATPEALDPLTGWQNIFVTETDREHLAVLSDAYAHCEIETRNKIFRLLQVSSHPEFKRSAVKPYAEDDIYGFHISSELNSYEIECVKKVNYSTSERRKNEIVLYRVAVPSSFCNTLTEKFSLSLVKWLKANCREGNDSSHLLEIGLNIKVKYPYRGDRQRYFPSEVLIFLTKSCWLPSTKGLVPPNQAFLPKDHITELLADSVPYFTEELPGNIVELLGIRTEANAEVLISLLEQHSEKGSGSKDMTERVYRALGSRELSYDIRKRLRESALIFVPSGNQNHWVSMDETIWTDRSDVLGDDFIYLSKFYPKLRDFFVDSVGVKEDVDAEAFALQWQKLQDASAGNSKEIEKALSAIYREIKPICELAEGDRPDWWRSFKGNVRIWTQHHTFENPDSVYVPDDGDLKEIFRGKRLSFAWRPPNSSYSNWEAFYRELGVSYLSESVKVELADDSEFTINDQAEFLTDAAKVLIVCWLKERKGGEYQTLLEAEAIGCLLNTGESWGSGLELIYSLDDEEIIEKSEAFWNKSKRILLISGSPNGRLKNSIARMLARDLIRTSAYKDLADWIELVLGEKDWKWRVEQNSWRLPDEVNDWLKGLSQEEPLDAYDKEHLRKASLATQDNLSQEKQGTEYESVAEIGPTSSSALEFQSDYPGASSPGFGSVQPTSIPTSSRKAPPQQHFDFLSEFTKVFSRKELRRPNDGIGLDARPVADVDRRREKEADAHLQNIEDEPAPSKRRKQTMRTILEGPDEQVRKTLEEWYGGKCQICEGTFFQRDGRPFFIANYIVPRKFARQVDTYANSLCLCAEHFAKWQHGAVEAQDIMGQINSMRCKAEGGEGSPHLRIFICGEECIIRFHEKHMIALQELLNVCLKTTG